MTDTNHLGLPFIEVAQAQKHVTHNEALRALDAIVMLAVLDRDLSAPPGSPAAGDRYLVMPTGSGAFADKDHQIAHFIDGAWTFHAPRVGWICYVADEGAIVVWNGTAWAAAAGSALQNLALLGLGTMADSANPFSAKLNNALWAAKTAAEGGDGHLRCKLSKESAASTLSVLFQDNFSGRAEIGLTGDDDFHFKTSPDGASFTDALVLEAAAGATRIAKALALPGKLSPPQIVADQDDFHPAGLAGAAVLRLSSNAARNLTGLHGGGDGRTLSIVNVGANDIVLKNEAASSAAGNRFALGADVTLAAGRAIALWYDFTDSRWRRFAG